MLKKNLVIVFFMLIALIFFLVYQQIKIPEGVTPLSDKTEVSAWLSLATSVIALIAATIGLIEKIWGKK